MSWIASGHVKHMTKAPNGVRLTPTEKYVLLVMADYYNDEKQAAWPSYTELAERTLLTRPTVNNTLLALKSKGAIEVVERRATNGSLHSNIYRFPWLVIPAKQESERTKKATPEPPTPSKATLLPTGTGRGTPSKATELGVVKPLNYPSKATLLPNIGKEDLVEESREEDLDSAPNGAVARTRAHEPSEAPGPYDAPVARKLTPQQLIINAYLTAVGRDPFAVGKGYKQHLAPGIELTKSGATPEEVAACTECLMTDHWRQSAGKPPTLADVAAYIAMWRQQGCPCSMPVREKVNGTTGSSGRKTVDVFAVQRAAHERLFGSGVQPDMNTVVFGPPQRMLINGR